MTTVVSLFLDHSAAHPDHVALEDWTTLPPTRRQFTYRDIDNASSRFSHKLTQCGVRSGDYVPVLTTRSPAMVVAVLAILKAGASYVPIDLSSWGLDRINSTLREVEPTTVVTTEQLDLEFSQHNVVMFANSDLDDMIQNQGDEIGSRSLRSLPAGDDLAYIIFTSGSTGKPKGVMVAHSSMANYARSNGAETKFNVQVRSTSRILMLFSVAFDGCAGVLFSTLCNGGCLVLANPATFMDAAKTCTELPLTPSILSTLDPAGGYDTVESVLLGGESASDSLVKAWQTPNRRIFNAYGPTEATCVALMAELQPGEPIVLGYPVNETTVLLLDENNAEAERGEICIGGSGLAVGYFKDSIRTAAAFVTWRGQRIYRTGDFGVNTPAGIAFAGRKDALVKNRGYLINLESEIEPAIMSISDVTQAIALMHDGRLHAFVTPSLASKTLRDQMIGLYSKFFIPDIVIGLDQFPVTSNGKIDRNTLRASLIGTSIVELSSLVEADDPLCATIKAFAFALGTAESLLSGNSSFRELGGSSLGAAKVVTALRKQSYSATLLQIFSLDKAGAIAEALTKLQTDQEQHASSSTNNRRTKLWEIVKHNVRDVENISDIAPMTETQLKLIHGTLKTSTVNYLQFCATFDHNDNPNFVQHLRKAMTTTLTAHSILRTRFLLSEGEGIQLVYNESSFGWHETFASETSWSTVCNQHLLSHTKTQAFTSNHLPSLMEFRLATMPSLKTRLTWIIHHSMADGWSMASFMKDLATVLHGAALSTKPAFHEISASIDDITNARQSEAVAWWNNKLGDLDPIPRLTLPHANSSSPSPHSNISMKLNVGLSDIERVCSTGNVTTAAIFYAAWAVVLSRYCASEDVVVGSVLAGRHLPVDGIADAFGPLLAILPLRITVDESLSDVEFYRSVFRSLCELTEYSWSTNAAIQAATGTRGTDFFETLLAMQFGFPESEWNSTTLSAPYDIDSMETSEFPLTILLETSGNVITSKFLYATSRFDDAVIQRMMQHFDHILCAMVTDTGSKSLHDISRDLIGTEELLHLTDSFEDLHQQYSGPATVKDAFEIAATRFGNLTAVESIDKSLTYAALHQQSNIIARALVEMGTINKFVCVLADGSLEWIVGTLAIMKAGLAYCPVDYKLPAARQRLMTELADTQVMLYPTAKSIPQKPLSEAVKAFAIDTLLETSSRIKKDESIENIDVPVTPDDVVCLIFTSGSTGIPKGVQLQNKGMLSVLGQKCCNIHSGPGQRNAQTVAYGFDICLMEIFGTLLHGATLVLKDENDPLGHLTRVDAACITPSILGTLDSDEYRNLKIITVAGEAVPQTIVEKWAPGRCLINGYGPAEATIAACFSYLRAGKKAVVGRPPPRMAAYIMDKHNRPVPVGVTGEIVLSGIQVTPGYLKMPSKTQEVFLSDPFHEGFTMYKTGDLGRWNHDMEIEVIGRVDNQVKVRGFRVDLIEVEAMVSKICPAVETVAVVLAGQTLVAYVSPGNLNTDEMLLALSREIPYYCQPERIVAMDKLPLNVNHKLDRKLMASLNVGQVRSIVPLSTPTEKLIASIWQETLTKEKLPAVSALDDFIAVGGHSLLQIRVAQKLSKALGRSVLLKTVIKNVKLRDLAATLDLDAQSPSLSPPSFLNALAADNTAQESLSYLESEILKTYVASNQSTALNMPFAARLRGNINLELLSRAFVTIIERHAILRSRFKILNGTPKRAISESITPPSFFPPSVTLEDFLKNESNFHFDLYAEQPIRVSFLKENEISTVVSVTMSHIVSDATTLNILLGEVSEVYRHLSLQMQTSHEYGVTFSEINASPKTYSDWVAWTGMNDQSSAENLRFWKKYLAGVQQTPLSDFVGKAQSFQGFCRHLTLNNAIRESIEKAALAANVTKHHVVSTAVALTMQSILDLDEIVLGAPYSNRDEPGTENIIGLLLDRLPIRIDLNNEHRTSVAEVLRATKASSQAAMSHVVPISHIMKAIGVGYETGKPPIFDVMVTYHTEFETKQKIQKFGECEMDLLHVHADGAKYPVMFEFSESDGQLVLDLEYDSNMLNDEAVSAIESMVTACLENIGQSSLELIQSVLKKHKIAFTEGSLSDASSSTDSIDDRELVYQEKGLHVLIHELFGNAE